MFGPASARSYKICVVGNNSLVGNAVFSETAQRIFLIFCIKLGGYKGRKVVVVQNAATWRTFNRSHAKKKKTHFYIPHFEPIL